MFDNVQNIDELYGMNATNELERAYKESKDRLLIK